MGHSLHGAEATRDEACRNTSDVIDYLLEIEQGLAWELITFRGPVSGCPLILSWVYLQEPHQILIMKITEKSPHA